INDGHGFGRAVGFQKRNRRLGVIVGAGTYAEDPWGLRLHYIVRRGRRDDQWRFTLSNSADDGLGTLARVGAKNDGNVILVHDLGDALDGLVRLALVIIKIQLDLLAQHTAFGVDLIQRDGIAVFVRFAKGRHAASQGGDHPDLGVGLAPNGG